MKRHAVTAPEGEPEVVAVKATDSRFPPKDGAASDAVASDGGPYELVTRVLDALPDPVFVKDAQHRWIVFNDAFCTFMGRSRAELLGNSDFEFCPPEEARVFWAQDELVLSTGEVNENEELFTDSDGNKHVLLTKKAAFSAPDGSRQLVATIRDVTERRRLDAELARTERLAASAELALRVAHEVNSPLAGVTGNVSYALEMLARLQARGDVPESNEIAACLRDALDAADRVGRIVSELHSLAEVAPGPGAITEVEPAPDSRTMVRLDGTTTTAKSTPAEPPSERSRASVPTLLPAPLDLDPPADVPAPASARSHEGAVVEALRARILFVDDEPMLHKVAQRVLGVRHVVTTVDCGQSALQALERSPRGFDAIICDLRMPQMGGFELYDVIAKRWPELIARIVFATGGADGPSSQARLEEMGRPWIAKPYGVTAMRSAVTDVLGRCGPNTDPNE